jgi:hypothetical protein
MATATKTKPFNYDLFRKRVRLFDSDSHGERDLAIHQALIQCAESDPPLHFWEAAGAAFGGVDRDERARLEERAARAEAEAEDQRRKAESNAETAAQQKEISDRLRQDNARLAEELEKRPDAREEFNWSEVEALQPIWLFVTLGAGLMCEWFAASPAGKSWLGDNAGIVAEWVHAPCMVLFVVWNVSVYKCEGFKQLLRDWAGWAGAWAFVVLMLHGTDPAFDIGSPAFRQLLVPYRWWATMGGNFSQDDCAFAIGSLVFVMDVTEGLPVTRWVLAKLARVLSAMKERLEALGD